MIKIELIDGTVLDNDPAYGWNLDYVGEILECLGTSTYRWAPPGGGHMRELTARDVKRVYEV